MIGKSLKVDSHYKVQASQYRPPKCQEARMGRKDLAGD